MRKAPATASSSTACGRTTNIVRTPSRAGARTLLPPISTDEHGVYPNDRLAAYEYRKHGTCTGLSPHDYFATVRSVRSRLKIPEMFQATSEPLHMGPEEIEQAFMTANPNLHPDNMAISCSNGELVDVRFCLAKDLSSYAVCRKVARHTCQRTSIVVAPVR